MTAMNADTRADTHADKAARFTQLHRGPAAFVMPNPWDAGSALILANLGFEALATSSAACAMALGRRDGEITRDEALAHARAIVLATDLPVAADLENGFGHAPSDAATTIRLAGEIGLCGGSIEDASGDAARPLYDFEHAVDRVAAAAEAARAHPFPFMLTARTENYLRGNPDLDDTIRRLQAFEKAGADVLFAPGLSRAEDIRTVCSSVSRPVSIMLGFKGADFSVGELAALGVRRISVGPALYLARATGCRVTGIDANESGVATATDMAARSHQSEQVRFRLADANARLPFEDDSFDALLCIDSMNHFPDRLAVLREWRRVLRVGRRAVFTDPVVITGPVTNDELALRSSIGLFLFVPAGFNERLIEQAGFRLLRQEDVTENAARISGRWHQARNARKEDLLRIEGETRFEGLQRFFETVNRLTSQRRLSRIVYLVEKSDVEN